MPTISPETYYQENHQMYDTFFQSGVGRIYFKTEDLWKFVNDFSQQLNEEEKVIIKNEVPDGIPAWLNLPTRRNALELWNQREEGGKTTTYQERGIHLLISRAKLSDEIITFHQAEQLFHKYCINE